MNLHPYIILHSIDNGKIYIKKDVLDQLKTVNAAIFDCDGVLIDARISYNMSIIKTVTELIFKLTKLSIPVNSISNEVISTFKKTGGFNNDWDLSYAILMYIMCQLPNYYRKIFSECISTMEDTSNSFNILNTLIKHLNKEPQAELIFELNLNNLELDLLDFALSLDDRGIETVDKILYSKMETENGISVYYQGLKKLLGHTNSSVFEEDLLALFFEEIFRGARFFTDSCGLKPKFNTRGSGFIDNETIIINSSTLEKLKLLFGSSRFGIASGSFFKPVEYVLNSILEKFNSKALIFYEDIQEAQKTYLKEKNRIINLKKPHPYTLLKSALFLEPFDSIIYVGDSMEDLIAVQRARDIDPRFLFVGVYGNDPSQETTLNGLLSTNCDVIIPNVNEIPYIIEWTRRN